MELQEFIAQSIVQIVTGVAQSGEIAASHNAIVNPRDLTVGGAPKSYMFDRSTGRVATSIEFDVAVTTSTVTEAGGKFGIFVGAIELGSKASKDWSSSAMSRIRFCVHVELPTTTDDLEGRNS